MRLMMAIAMIFAGVFVELQHKVVIEMTQLLQQVLLFGFRTVLKVDTEHVPEEIHVEVLCI